MSVSTKSSSDLASRATWPSISCEARARRVRARQRVDVHARAGRLEQLVQILGRCGEALLVIRFAAEPGDGDVVVAARAPAGASPTDASRRNAD